MHDDVDQSREALVDPDSGDNNLSKSCVVMKLNQFVRDRRILSHIDSAVRRCNVLVLEAYEFANFHIHRLLREDTPLPILDRNFYYRCVACVGVTNVRPGTIGQELHESALLFDAHRPPGQQRTAAQDLMEIIPDLTITMQTAVYNHLWCNLFQRTGRWLKYHHPHLKKFSALILALVFKAPKRKLVDVKGLRLENPPHSRARPLTAAARHLRLQAREVVDHLRGLCPLVTSKKAMTKSHTLLHLYWMLYQDSERIHQVRCQQILRGEKLKRTPVKRFDLLPRKKSFTPMFIPVHTRQLLLMVTGIRRRDGSCCQFVSSNRRSVADRLAQGRDTEADAIWRTWFNLNSVETKSTQFGYRIITDGVGVTIVMNKPTAHILSTSDATDDPIDISAAPRTQPLMFAGVDPGLTDVVTVAHQKRRDAPPKTKTYVTETSSYSSRKYYEDAKFNASRHRTAKWRAETEDVHLAMRADRDHGSQEGFSTTLRYTLANARMLLEHRMTKGFRNMRFLRTRFKMKAVNAICDLIAPHDKYTVVGYGDWKGVGATPIKRACSGPQRAIKRELLRREREMRCMFVHINEWRTSILNCITYERMENMVARSTVRNRDGQLEERKASKIHKVLHCKNSDMTTWNRDVNASTNILMLLMLRVNGQPRPVEFRRGDAG